MFGSGRGWPKLAPPSKHWLECQCLSGDGLRQAAVRYHDSVERAPFEGTNDNLFTYLRDVLPKRVAWVTEQMKNYAYRPCLPPQWLDRDDWSSWLSENSVTGAACYVQCK